MTPTNPDPVVDCRTCPGRVRQSKLDARGRCGICVLYDLTPRCETCGDLLDDRHADCDPLTQSLQVTGPGAA